MVTQLNLFPARVPFGSVTDSQGNKHDVYMTPEFSRALAGLMQRVGGSSAMSVDEIAVLQATETEDAALSAALLGGLRSEEVHSATVVRAEAQAAVLAGGLLAVEAHSETVADMSARIAVLERLVEDLSRMVQTAPGPVPTDWEHPGKIGDKKANTGVFTTVTASGQVTGANTYSVAPAIKATTTAVNLASTFASTNSDSSQFLVGYSGSSVDPTSALWWKTGTTFRFATADDTQATGFVQRGSWSASGLVVVAGFGCNGKTAQAAVALGAASVDLPTVITLANNIRSALIANGIGS